jgi:hypothetical protein
VRLPTRYLTAKMDLFRVKRLALVVVCFAFMPCALLAAEGWEPSKTWLFAIGILEWRDGAAWSVMQGAKKDRRDVQLVNWFKSMGVPPEQIVYLQDRQATLQGIRSALNRLLAKTRDDDLLVFYFTGHGFRDHETHRAHFANYDARSGADAWPVAEVVETIESDFRGRQAMLLADCCFSGALLDEALRQERRVAYGCLCSSFSHNTSTGNWTFTDLLLKGLRGEPAIDADGDRAIRWDELARAAALEMAFVEGQKAADAATKSFDRRFKLASASGPRRQRVGERLEVKWNNQWYRAQIVDAKPQWFKIHYAGYDDSWNEWVTGDRLRPYRLLAIAAGKKVLVKSEGKWYTATVLRGWYGLHFVHYDGWAAEWDEWVPADSIKKR